MMMASSQSGGGGGNNVLRDYRKGNWTVEETMILIEAKKMDDERRMKSERGKPTEQRWKWVEDFCWRKGCFRSQSQCNDKWDNLMRDFKKVREYERRITSEEVEKKSYWRIEKNERKEKNLPSNMLSQIYEALVDVVERRGGTRSSATSSGGGGGGVEIRPLFVGQPPPPPPPPTLLPPIMQQTTQNPTGSSGLPPLSLTPPPPPQIAQPMPATVGQESDASEHSDSPAKRRKREGTSGGGGGGSGGGGGGSSSQDQVGTAISRSATIIAEAIQANEEREERRHRKLVTLHERRLQIEESKAEITRQGINGMVDAINKLANSILALASNKNK